MSRRASRSALDPSPSVIRPATSTTLTSPTWRVLNLTLTYVNLLTRNLLLFSDEILGQRDLCPRRAQAANMQLIHKCADEKDATTRITEKIVLRQRVGQSIQIEACALIRNRHGQPVLPFRDRYT